MKRSALVLLALLSTYAGFGQGVKPIKKTKDGYIEKYSVLVADNGIRQGDYKRYSPKGQTLMEGTYDNNQKVGEWKFYVDGELEQVFDFSTKQLTFSKTHGESCMTETDGKREMKILDTPPMYLGSKARLALELAGIVYYPNQAQRMGIEGKVIAGVWIDVNNEINIEVEKGISPDCDHELVEALKKVDKDWVAGRVNGAPVKAKYTVEFTFKLAGR